MGPLSIHEAIGCQERQRTQLWCVSRLETTGKTTWPNLCEQRGCCFFLGGDVCSCTAFPRFVCFLFLLGIWNGRIKHENRKISSYPAILSWIFWGPQMPLMDTAMRSWTWHLPHNQRSNQPRSIQWNCWTKICRMMSLYLLPMRKKDCHGIRRRITKKIRCSTLTPMVWRVRLAKIHQSGVDKHRWPRMSKTLWIGFVDVQRFPEAQALGKLAAQSHEESKTSAMCLQFVTCCDMVILCYKISCSGHFRLLKNWCWCDDVWGSLIINSIHRSSDLQIIHDDHCLIRLGVWVSSRSLSIYKLVIQAPYRRVHDLHHRIMLHLASPHDMYIYG